MTRSGVRSPSAPPTAVIFKPNSKKWHEIEPLRVDYVGREIVLVDGSQPTLIDLVAIGPSPGAAGNADISLLLRKAPNRELVENIARDVAAAQHQLYARTDAKSPWVGYFVLDRVTGDILGSCSFVGAPRDGSVEIAYFTFPPYEGKRIGSAMAAELMAIARTNGSVAKVHALTLPEHNRSTRILERLGFHRAGIAQDDEAGEVWRWERFL